MTKEEYLNYPEDIRGRFDEPLELVSKFMTPKGHDISEYKEKLINEISAFECIKLDKTARNGGGDCQLQILKTCKSKNKLINIIFNLYNKIDNNTTYKIYVNTYEHENMSDFLNFSIANHEINHADTYMYKEINKRTLYSGLSKISDYPFGICIFMGKQLNEAINETINQLQIYLDNPRTFKTIKDIDELIYSIPVDTNNFYYEIILFSKLLLVVCDNDLTVPYSSLENTEEIFFNKTINLNGHRVFKNDLLYAGKYNCIKFEKHFNDLCGKTSYNLLCISYDNLFDEFKRSNTISSNALSCILSIIDEYKNKKYTLMEKLGFWDKQKKEYHEKVYSEYKSFIEKISEEKNKNDAKKLTEKNQSKLIRRKK